MVSARVRHACARFHIVANCSPQRPIRSWRCCLQFGQALLCGSTLALDIRPAPVPAAGYVGGQRNRLEEGAAQGAVQGFGAYSLGVAAKTSVRAAWV